jgi:DNA-binding response OmpR family regulator
MAPTILVVEDDDGIALPLMRALRREGYAVERTETGGDAVDRVGLGDIDLVVLDLGLPDLDGLEVCRWIRVNAFDGPVLILTARGGELDRVVGLDVGADDYMAKPFGLAELLARVRALLRRASRSVSDTQSVNASASSPSPSAPSVPVSTSPQGLRLDASARRAWVGDVEIELTTKEFDVLALLLVERGAVVTREELMDRVWDENWFGSTKTLDVTIGRLRQKLASARSTTRVTAVRGVGFRIDDDA